MYKLIVTASIALFCSAMGIAQAQETFTNEEDALKLLNAYCSKFWSRQLLPNEVSYELKVYENDCELYFEVKDFFGCAPGETQPCLPKVMTTLTKISLENINVSACDSALILRGGKKCVATLSFMNTTGWNKQADFASSYTLPLNYTDSQLFNKWQSINRALVYLTQKCHE